MKYILYIILFLTSFFLTFPPNTYGNNFPNKSDIYWLTQNIYHESRGEDLYGKLMVGMVTLERLRSGKWGNTIQAVVTSPKQFSWYSDGKSDIPDDWDAWNSSKSVALLSIMIYNNIKEHGVMYYHNKSVSPYWSKKMVQIATVGNHIFYVDKSN